MIEQDTEYYYEEPVFHRYDEKSISYYSDNIIWVIMEALQNANTSVKVNMAYLTSELIINMIKDLPQSGISVEIIISNTVNNRNKYGIYNELLSRNISLFEFGDDEWTNGIMHRKSVIIDSKIVLSGSYNWTHQAEKNTEELFIIEELDIVKKVEKEFEKLKAKCNALIFQQTQLGHDSKCTKEKNVEIIKWWSNLDKIWQNEFTSMFNLNSNPSIEELIMLTNSESISIKYSDIEDLSPLIQFNNLKKLSVYSCKKIQDLSPLKQIKTIEYLDVAATSVEKLDPISELYKLIELDISNTKIKNIDVIENLKLKKLYLFNVNLPYSRKRAIFFTNNPNCKINGSV